MRKIDADHLKKTLKKLKAEGNNQRYVQGLQNAIDDYFPQIIDDEPTIEDTAHWEICCDGYYPYCSECKEEPQGREMTKYCPNCGRKMVNK